MAVGTLLSNAFGIEPQQREGLYSTPMREATEGATQTFKKGALLINSGGHLIVAAADAVAGIVGVAAEAGHNAAAGVKTVKYYPAHPHVVFEATFEDQLNENHILVAANRWGAFAIQVDTPGNFYIDENDTTNQAARIVAFKDALGTTRARVLFQFLIDTTIYGT